MNNSQSLSHSKWDCKYHLVWIPKYRRKVLYGRIRQHLGDVIRELARQRESQVLEGHVCSDHVHVYIVIPPNVCGRSGRRLYQRKERNSYRPDIWQTLPQFYRGELLGKRLFCFNCRT